MVTGVNVISGWWRLVENSNICPDLRPRDSRQRSAKPLRALREIHIGFTAASGCGQRSASHQGAIWAANFSV